MYSSLLITLLVATASAIYLDEDARYKLGVYRDDVEGFAGFEPDVEVDHHRQRRQLGSVFYNSDHTSGANIKIPVAGGDKHMFSAIGAAGLDAGRHLTSATGGLAYDHANGHGLSLTHTHIPKFGSQMTGAGHVNLLHTPDHSVNANAFLTRNMPTIPQVPHFSTVGGGVDYMFRDKIGASLGAAHTPFLQRTDYSATGNLNLFKNPTSSLDFNAGISKSVSPFAKSSWQPTSGFTFRKFF